ncbi:T9SS type A sorting domain-containing protein [Aequorivita sp. H23M31]|uniref:T9SS type A sorting domain-containing protein n=1 Tax=Aequorivita ciconiae TaxID=2494375 RepID=A0A410G070_9FLAO|nr:T9SS type A sorting domain-containing protein [Aequorivita sp. H23M31]QAA80640.1 T9SS type A sorting domain-containing protein [Aequorivita sp. H23M31]
MKSLKTSLFTLLSLGVSFLYSQQNYLTSQNNVEVVIPSDPAVDCVQEYGIDRPIFQMGLAFSTGNKVANDVVIDPYSTFNLQMLTFEAFAENGYPTGFTIQLHEDNGSGGVGSEIGSAYIFNQGDFEATLIDDWSLYRVVIDLSFANVLLINNTNEMKFYWISIASELFSTGDIAFWNTALYTNGPSNPQWVNWPSAGGEWMPHSDNTEGIMTVEGTCETLSIEDVNSFEIALYPNPVSDFLNIKLQKTIRSIQIYNMAGGMVLSFNELQNGKIDISTLKPGIYMCKIITEIGEVKVFKVVKK